MCASGPTRFKFNVRLSKAGAADGATNSSPGRTVLAMSVYVFSVFCVQYRYQSSPAYLVWATPTGVSGSGI